MSQNQRTAFLFLSKIPLIGNLFGNTSDQTNRTELIILLTPHIMRDMKEAGNVTTDYLNKYEKGTNDKDINKFIKEKSQLKQGDEGSSKAK